MMSDYSIKEWENRPLSRNEGILGLKDENRITVEA